MVKAVVRNLLAAKDSDTVVHKHVPVKASEIIKMTRSGVGW